MDDKTDRWPKRAEEGRVIFEHVTYDLFDCDPSFLSEVREGASALRLICVQANFTIVREFEEKFHGGGYSCVLILGESHASLHTWPESGYCAVDFFVCSGEPDRAEALLKELIRPQRMSRQLILRGPGAATNETHWIKSEGSSFYYEAYRVDKLLFDRRSSLQRIQVVEHQNHGRVLFLDGDIQLASSDESVYHETLVHPAMLAHPCVKSVGIIGGGDGATAREVLTYSNVERVVLVEADEVVVDAARRHLSDVSGGVWCDPRLEVVIGDAVDWIGSEVLDVLVVDLTAPNHLSSPAYEALIERAASSLHGEGFLSLHSGWWMHSAAPDLPVAVGSRFTRVLLHNAWIESFNCFWSFIVAWNHERGYRDVLDAIRSSDRDHFRNFSPKVYSDATWRRTKD